MEGERRPRRTRPLVAEPLETIDVRDPELVDLRELAAMTWEESASLVEYSPDLRGQGADRPRYSLLTGSLREHEPLFISGSETTRD